MTTEEADGGFRWPDGFSRRPDEDWTRQSVEDLALNYDTVERHGWYANLDTTVDQLAATLRPDDILVDYSGGTGILEERLLDRIGGRELGVVMVDSSRKFLRLALDKFDDDPRVAFRLLPYSKEERRLRYLDEVLDPPLLDRGVDALVSTNAIHLYYDLPDTLAAWRRVLRPDGHVFVQSGNIGNPDCPDGTWIIDETVDVIHRAAMEIVRTDTGFGSHRGVLDDAEYMAEHDELRRKYFLPVRPLDHYLDALRDAGFDIETVENRRIEARVDEWYDFLSVYHEGVLGWVGGAEKVTGAPAPEPVVEDRLTLMRHAMERVFEGRETFDACWTYITARPRE